MTATRTVVASADAELSSWLRGVLTSAGLSVAVVDRPSPTAPELHGGELLIADRESATAIGEAGPQRRMLLVPKGRFVDMADALASGFVDLLVVPAPEDEVLGRVGRALDHFLRPSKQGENRDAQIDELKSVVSRVVDALRRVRPEVRRQGAELAHGMLSVFLMLVDAHESTERAAPGHSKRVARLARAMWLELDLPAGQAPWVELGARLQDIGFLPLRLSLSGRTPLAPELRRALVEHARLSADILRPLGEWGLPITAVERHHERIDGSGYPDRLSGDQVPLDAQVLGASDVYEALTSRRPWRPASSREDALDAMRSMRGFSDRVLRALAGASSKPAPPPRVLVRALNPLGV